MPRTIEIATVVETTQINTAEELAKFFANGGKITCCAPNERSIAPGEAPLLDESFDGESD